MQSLAVLHMGFGAVMEGREIRTRSRFDVCRRGRQVCTYLAISNLGRYWSRQVSRGSAGLGCRGALPGDTLLITVGNLGIFAREAWNMRYRIALRSRNSGRRQII